MVQDFRRRQPGEEALGASRGRFIVERASSVSAPLGLAPRALLILDVDGLSLSLEVVRRGLIGSWLRWLARRLDVVHFSLVGGVRSRGGSRRLRVVGRRGLEILAWVHPQLAGMVESLLEPFILVLEVVVAALLEGEFQFNAGDAHRDAAAGDGLDDAGPAPWTDPGRIHVRVGNV